MQKNTDDYQLNYIESRGLSVWSGRARGMARAHTHQDLEFNYVHQGWLKYFIAGQVVTILAGHLAVIWGAMPHQAIEISDDLFMAWGTYPFGNTFIKMLPTSFVELFLGTGMAMTAKPCNTDWPLFERWESDLKQDSAARQDLVQREMELRLMRLAIDVTDERAHLPKSGRVSLDSKTAPKITTTSPKTSTSMSTTNYAIQPSTPRGVNFVQHMAFYMTNHYTERLQLEDITAQVPLHPNYAMTLFRQYMHMTLNTYLTLLRVNHAQRLLATTDQTILSIAMDSGFGSLSRFFEAFKQHTGCSPRAFRNKLTSR